MSLYLKFIVYFFLLSCLLMKLCIGLDINIGTTIFTKSDCYKQCWSDDDLALLTSRMLFEDLLPNPTVMMIESNDGIYDLIDYFELILDIVKKETYGKTKYITLIALADTLGGYLHHTILPITRYAYYSGIIDYDAIEILIKFYNELKYFLRTNGEGWSKPINGNNYNYTKKLEAIHLENNNNDDDYCDDLIIVNENDVNELTIPLPFFDSIIQPTAIALPLKTQPLHNLYVNNSVNLFNKFFIQSFKCLQSKHVDLLIIEQYKNNFIKWINQQILPRLNDPVLYTAFGSVLRILYTLKSIGTKGLNEEQSIKHIFGISNHKNMILVTILLILFILAQLFICYRIYLTRKKRNHYSESCGSDKSTITTTCSCMKSTSSKDVIIPISDINDDEEHTQKYLFTIEEKSETSKKAHKNQRFPLAKSPRVQFQKSSTILNCCDKCNSHSNTTDFTTSDSSIVTDDLDSLNGKQSGVSSNATSDGKDDTNKEHIEKK